MKYFLKILFITFVFHSCSSPNDATAEVPKLDSECQAFLDDYANEINNYLDVITQIEQNGSGLDLMLKRNSIEENMQSFFSDPTMLKCGSGKLFSSKMDSLNALMEI